MKQDKELSQRQKSKMRQTFYEQILIDGTDEMVDAQHLGAVSTEKVLEWLEEEIQKQAKAEVFDDLDKSFIEWNNPTWIITKEKYKELKKKHNLEEE